MFDLYTVGQLAGFVISGSVSPMLTQVIEMNGGADPSTMIIFLPSYIGMSLSIFTNWSAQNQGIVDWKLIFLLVAIDLASSKLTFRGLIDAGATIFTIVYCSVTIFTAIFATVLLKRPLNLMQWLGIVVVTLGLCVVGVGSKDDGLDVLDGIGLILIGSMIHSLSYIIAEHVLVHAEDPIAPELLCTLLGITGGVVNIFWQVAYTLPRYELLIEKEVEYKHGNVWVLLGAYVLLITASCINCSSFYYLLGRVGSATTGVMKGVQAVTTFVSCHFAFCHVQSSQCFTPCKGAALLIVLVGVMIYSLSSSQTTSSAVPICIETTGVIPVVTKCSRNVTDTGDLLDEEYIIGSATRENVELLGESALRYGSNQTT